MREEARASEKHARNQVPSSTRPTYKKETALST